MLGIPLALAFVAFPQHRLFDLEGSTPGANFGCSVSLAGDVNADGWPDLLIGEREYDGLYFYGGSAHVYSGQDGSLLYTFYGDARMDAFGSHACGLGDLNGDGFDDFGVGAKGSDIAFQDAGMVRIFSGRDGTVLGEAYGKGPFDYFGQSLATLGDLTGDGVPDFIIGARESDLQSPGSGYVQVFSGADGSLLFEIQGDSDFDWFGKFVGGPGDINRDGVPDFLVGAKGDDNAGLDSGSARLYSGANGHVLHHWNGSPGSWFGTTTVGAGDVDADGWLDILIGAYRHSSNGKIENGALYVISGATYQTIWILYGDDTRDWFSKCAVALGDVDGDGHADFASAAYRDDNVADDAGTVRVYSGATGAVIYTFNGRSMDDHAGYSLAGPGDLDLDGIPDLLVGANGALDNKEGSATVYRLWSLALTAQSNVASGSKAWFQIRGCSPQGPVGIAFGLERGVYVIPHSLRLNPASLDIGDFKTSNGVGKIANGQGVIQDFPWIPSAMSGWTVFLQAYDVNSSTVSNIIRMSIF